MTSNQNIFLNVQSYRWLQHLAASLVSLQILSSQTILVNFSADSSSHPLLPSQLKTLPTFEAPIPKLICL